MKNIKHFLSITDLTAKEIWQLILQAKKMKDHGVNDQVLQGKNAVLLFEKPSLRTKLSFDIGITQLGGHPIYFGPNEASTGSREDPSDVAKVISSMADLLITRVFSHTQLEKLATASQIPVINALSDLEHPCQILADLLTIYEFKGKLEGLKLAYVGDCENNVTHSLALACSLLGINFSCAAPKGFWMKPAILKKSIHLASSTLPMCPITKCPISQVDNPEEAVKDADVVYTDSWISMGDEAEANKRLKIFRPYQVTSKLMSLAKKDAIFMHDMPAKRGNEVSSDVADGPQSVMFQQAENRLHAQKGLMYYIFTSQQDNWTNKDSKVKMVSLRQAL